jgi:hypothetical protein
MWLQVECSHMTFDPRSYDLAYKVRLVNCRTYNSLPATNSYVPGALTTSIAAPLPLKDSVR